jgi:hypothetical protein
MEIQLLVEERLNERPKCPFQIGERGGLFTSIEIAVLHMG